MFERQKHLIATYYPGSSSRSDNLQISHLGDLKLASCSELLSNHTNMTRYKNPTPSAGSCSDIFYRGSLSSQNCAEFSFRGARNEMVFIPPTSDMLNLQCVGGKLNTAAGNLVGNPGNGDSQEVPPGMQLGVPGFEQNFLSRGLSLSLSTQVQSAASVPSLQCQYRNQNFPSSPSSHLHVPEKWTLPCEGDESNQSKEFIEFEGLSGFVGSNHNRIKTESSHYPHYIAGFKDMDTVMNMHGLSGCANSILNSRFMKAAQYLLDEVVNVKKALKQPESNKCSNESKESCRRPDSCSMLPTSNETPSDSTESTADSTPEPTPVERQDLLNKKTAFVHDG